MKFSSRDFFSKCEQNRRINVNLFTFTKDIVIGKLHFFCSEQFLNVDTKPLIISL